MKLDSRQLNQVHQALLHAFDRDALRMMLRLQLDESLDAVTGDDDLTTVVFDLITWAERTNRLGDLVKGALAANPNNPELQQLAADYARWQAAALPPVVAPPTLPTDAPIAEPVTLPATPTPGRGPNWALIAGAIVVLALIAFWLLRPYLLPSGPVEPTPIGPTPIGPTPIGPTPIEPTLPLESPPATDEPSAEATVTPSPVPSATGTAEPTATSTPEPSATHTPEATATATAIATATGTATGTATITPSATPTIEAPRAPALRVGPLMTAFNEESRLLTIKSGESLTLDMRRLWSAPLGTPVDCASGRIIASWQVRQPYPGGEELEIRRTIPRAGGQTEVLAAGERGSVTLGYCDGVILHNLGLEDYRLEWRYVSAIAKPSTEG